jgi:formate hydrogenlyase subunit 3/multisubunit Na+/H+ antiporter MnhD subunit
MTLLLAALGILVASGLLAVALSPWPRLATGIAAVGAVAGSALGLGPSLAGLSGQELTARWPWTPPYGDLLVGLDRLSAFFLVPLFALAAATAVYGRAYLLEGKRRPLGAPALYFNLLIASMALIAIARDAIVLVVAWEAMALTSFLLVTFEDQEAEVRRAGWIYLVASQLGAMVLIALVLLLTRQAGGTEFAAFQRMTPPAPWASAGLAVLAIIACGVKAGLVPLHVWLPEAHAAAPSHMSALMSGASIKIALYGLLRLLSFLPRAAWWGPALILLGFAGAAFGISQALSQRDLKRVLAYSSIENVGLILIGLGIGFWGTSLGAPAVAALGAMAAGFHLWAHAAMKGLLFLCAGSVVHGAGTRDLERLGGLLRRMPVTSTLILFGAVAIAGLPPLTGFVGEWLLVRALFAGGLASSGAAGVAALLAVGALVLVGAMAALCFVRLAGIALLGNARSERAARAHESSAGIVVPMAVLAAACAVLSLRPGIALRPVAAFSSQLFGAAVSTAIESLAPSLATLGRVSTVLALAVALGAAILARRWRNPSGARPTWDCGYAAPTARMQYTGRSFAELATSRLLPGALSPTIAARRPAGLFPAPGELRGADADPLTRAWYEPFFTRWAERFVSLRWLQQGVLHAYLFYILAVAVAALTWVSVRDWVAP